MTTLCITTLDVLDGFTAIQVCVDYDDEQNPIYKTLPGWEQETSGIRDFNDLPQAAQDYTLFRGGVGVCCGCVSYTYLRAHESTRDLVWPLACKKKKRKTKIHTL